MAEKVKCQSSKWLERYFEGLTIDIDSSEFQSVKNFPLIWNIYESLFFEKDCSAKKSWERDAIHPTNDCASGTFEYFKKRYSEGDGAQERFEALNTKDHKDEVRNILAAEKPTIEEVNKACRMIVQRLRNNFFHGEKEMRNIASQIELFEYANRYLIGIIENRAQEA